MSAYQIRAYAIHSGVIDLKPFANDARAKIAAELTEFQPVGNGVRVDGSECHGEGCGDAIAADVGFSLRSCPRKRGPILRVFFRI
jgi:hypothetical protein